MEVIDIFETKVVYAPEGDEAEFGKSFMATGIIKDFAPEGAPAGFVLVEFETHSAVVPYDDLEFA